MQPVSERTDRMTGKEWAVLIFLGWNSVCDLKRRSISMWSVVGFGLAGLLCVLLDKEYTGWQAAAGLAPGALLMAASLVSGGAVGFGDGMALLVIGTYLGAHTALGALILGLFCAAVWGMGMLILKRGGRKTELPFVPFLLLGFLGHLVMAG